MLDNRLHIAVGVLVNARREVLLARRPYDLHQGGLWEFPGGKVEAGENVREALARELCEELNIHITHARPLIRIHHEYPEYPVILDVWCIDSWQGEAFGREGQPVEWVATHVLHEREFPAANQAILSAVRLPPLYLITPDLDNDHDAFLQDAEQCLRAGIRLIQLRCKRLLPEVYKKTVRELGGLCRQYDAALLLNGSPADAITSGADGIHLPSARLLQLNERPLDRQYLVAASCHNRMEVEHACRLGLDFIVVSPVQATASHPDAEPIGWDGLRWLTECATIPVYALGGMQPYDMSRAWDGGAQGIAMLSAVWQSTDPAAVVSACVG